MVSYVQMETRAPKQAQWFSYLYKEAQESTIWGGTFYSNFEKIFSLVDLSEAYEGVFQWRINWSSRSFFKFNSVKVSSALYCLRATFENNLTQPTLLAWLRHSGFCCPPYTKDWCVGVLLCVSNYQALIKYFHNEVGWKYLISSWCLYFFPMICQR